jgi:enamine deaminase RidA (YjgF/YER057c/UK114 family)
LTLVAGRRRRYRHRSTAVQEETRVSSAIERRLAEHGLELPDAPAPAANYVAHVISGQLVMIAGQLPFSAGELVRGRLGDDLDVEAGRAAARLCGLALLAQVKSACRGDLSRVARCLRLGGFVACVPEFTDHASVINGASDLMVHAMGEAGRHARFAIGCPSLPLGAAVEVEGVFELAGG